MTFKTFIFTYLPPISLPTISIFAKRTCSLHLTDVIHDLLKLFSLFFFFLTDYTYWQVLLKAGLGFLLSYAFQMIKQDKPVCICLYFFLLLSDICTNKIHIDVSTENNGI